VDGPVFSSRVTIGLRVNGTGHALDFDARTSLLDLLREHLRLTGTKPKLRPVR
jgi:aerobic-type carbon monoxide dehydrogenase small subunit (CoxS/CutS family)